MQLAVLLPVLLKARLSAEECSVASFGACWAAEIFAGGGAATGTNWHREGDGPIPYFHYLLQLFELILLLRFRNEKQNSERMYNLWYGCVWLLNGLL
jgi:hypothetical protein